MKYTFSEETKIERYGKPLYAIMEGDKTVAYSEVKFEIPDRVRFLGNNQAYIFKGATIWGGEIWGGEIWGGEIRGGEIRGGVIWGGVIRGGVYEVTLLQIQGSRHFCYLEKTDEGGVLLGIGCYKYTINEWKRQCSQIRENEDYSPAEIAEYKEYIDLYDRLYQPKNKSSKKVKPTI